MNIIFFVSNNIHKYSEIKSILHDRTTDLDVNFYKQNIIEIQDDQIEKIAIEKAKSAYNTVKRPIIIEDDGLFINSLNGFPGQYSSYVFKSIGNRGILRLLEGSRDRSAFFKSIFVYNNGIIVKVFSGQINGKISSTITDGGWGYDPIFIPFNNHDNHHNKTFAELSKTNKKNELSHRSIALDKFVKWFYTKQQIKKL
ncbi:MAG TPA: RdgB/HAM1 family non-canonical purine NTP pyrophosphatase [Nitrososphaeraceae archaeon]|jgi:XTP/dITP diphosphohydrolase|nr:RdgB/HAM1 family non-canonical purine NTP pyrophosphatase [Nitrososphaeraceae archaeon]HSL12936.1 RdgB/HAM1 family non-canonical purine NTP pyrophosphatase [Nitrososphaeraceae archaeon]